jgi:uncharacterized membrane protein
MWTALNLLIALPCLVVALWLRPWRMLRGPLFTPALASLVLLPWLWLLPQKMPQGLQVQLSGACLLVLMLGWPLAVPVLGAVAAVVWFVGQATPEAVLSQWVWTGLVPATLALGLGALLRRWLPPNPFVYTLGRAFLARRRRCSCRVCCSKACSGWPASRGGSGHWWRAGSWPGATLS